MVDGLRSKKKMHIQNKLQLKGKIKNEYQTDNYGGRLLYNKTPNNKMQVFGDSQVLGLDVENIEQHYLNTLYKKNDFVQ